MKRKFIATMLSALLLFAGCASSDPILNSTGEQASDETTFSAIGQIPEMTQVLDSDQSPSFIGVKKESNTEFSSLNNKSGTMQFFCCSENTVYFSNPADGLRLYSYDGENTKRLSDIQAFSLNYYDGSVYFLSSENPINFEDHTNIHGVLYQYDTKSGTVSQLGDTPMSNLRVDEKGIGYTLLEENGETAVYRFDPQSEEGDRLCRGFSVQHFGEYSLINEVKESGDGLNYFLESDREKIWILSDAITVFDCIENGVYYYRDYNDEYRLYSVDLQSGEKQLLYGDSGFEDYTVFERELYLTIQGRLYRVDQKDGLLLFESNAGGAENIGYYGYRIDTLYVGNGKMYALVSYVKGVEEIHRFAELELSDRDESVTVHEIG